MATNKKTLVPTQITIEDLLTKSEKVYQTDDYANHVQVSLTTQELLIDFFYLSPQFSKSNPIKMQHVSRVIAPIALAKGLATALANVVAEHEEENNIVLTNSRTPSPEDKITIWP